MVADDDLDLWVYSPNWSLRERFTLLPGVLPLRNPERKAKKPDFEAITLIGDTLFVFPSGSKANRTAGVAVNLGADGTCLGRTLIDLAPLYAELSVSIPELNIEGALAREDELLLFQRGNGGTGHNGIIRLGLESFLSGATEDRVVTAKSLLNVSQLSLGGIRQVPYSFTDATLWQNRVYFLAVAEDTVSTVDDGMFLGAVIGELLADGRVQTKVLDMPSKPEGLCFTEGNKFILVTDDDDEQKFSSIYEGVY